METQMARTAQNIWAFVRYLLTGKLKWNDAFRIHAAAKQGKTYAIVIDNFMGTYSPAWPLVRMTYWTRMQRPPKVEIVDDGQPIVVSPIRNVAEPAAVTQALERILFKSEFYQAAEQLHQEVQRVRRKQRYKFWYGYEVANGVAAGIRRMPRWKRLWWLWWRLFHSFVALGGH